MKRLAEIAILVLFLSSDYGVAQQDWHEPYKDDGTLGGELEKNFRRMLFGCGVGSLIGTRSWLRGGDKELSSIPMALQNGALPLGEPVRKPVDAALGRVMAYVYTEAETTNSSAILDDSLAIRGTDYVQDPVTMLISGGSNVFYAHTCSSVVSAAANAKAGWSIPAAQISAALSSEYGQDKSSSLVLVQGQFKSPIASALDSLESVNHMSVAFYIWNWYRTHSARASSKNYVVDQLHGVELYHLTKDKKQFDGAVQVSGGANAIFASVEASVKASISTDMTARIESYGMFALADAKGPWATFRVLPSLEDILGILESKSAVVEPYEQTVGSGTIHKHNQTVMGLPLDACNKDLWDIFDQSRPQAGQLTLDSASYDSVSKKCTFAVNFAAASTYLPSSIPLTYQLMSKAEVIGKRIIIATGPVQLASSTSPDLHAASSDWMYQNTNIGEGEHINHDLSWTLSMRVFDSADPVKSVDVSDLQLQCGKVLIPGINVDGTLTSPAWKNYKDLTLTIKRRVSWWEAFDVSNDPANVDRCVLTGDMKFTMATPLSPLRIVSKPVTSHWLFNPTQRRQTGSSTNAAPTNQAQPEQTRP